MKEYHIGIEHSDDIDDFYFPDLMSCCFKYSKFFSYEYFWCDGLKKPDNPPVEKILKYEVRDFGKMLTDEARENWKEAGVSLDPLTTPEMVRKYFEINEDTKNFVLSYGSLFAYWENDHGGGYNFEPAQNLAFYRDDQTVFFDSVTHEAECRIYPNENEDVSDIIGRRGWKKW
ncbi:MAG: hypothetical protein J6330_10145 [Clostridia bacterium]|nr:hypothetical protein [Clostridia bacterium]